MPMNATTSEPAQPDAAQGAMAHALQIALRGPRTLNPQTGAVVVSADGRTLAEGWHRGAGTPHAEVDALSKLSPGEAEGATMVVTLEPCNHFGRTGPCALALIEAGISRVVYGAADPGIESGSGAERLREAGVQVERWAVDEAEALIADWLLVQRTGRPRVTVKWAQSLDGRTAAADGTSQWITGDAAREHVHQQRAAHDAIAVGTGTVIADDPRLTARIEGASQPRPVVFGTRSVPADARIREHPHAFQQVSGDLTASLELLASQGVQSVYVEGGPTLASAFLREGLVDDIHVYIAPTLLGGDRLATGDVGVTTIGQQLRLAVSKTQQLGDDILLIAHPAADAAAKKEDA